MRIRKRERNPDSKVSSGLCEKIEVDLTGKALALSQTWHLLDLSSHSPLIRSWSICTARGSVGRGTLPTGALWPGPDRST